MTTIFLFATSKLSSFNTSWNVSKDLDNGKYIERLANVPVVVDSPLAKELADKFNGEKYCISSTDGFVCDATSGEGSANHRTQPFRYHP